LAEVLFAYILETNKIIPLGVFHFKLLAKIFQTKTMRYKDECTFDKSKTFVGQKKEEYFIIIK
jgi:hypothetical protein